MHPSPRFRETDPATLLGRIAAYPLGIVMVNGERAPLAVHTPVIARQDAGGIALRFHLSAANPVTARLLAGAAAFLDDLSDVFETALLPKPPWTRAKMKPAAFEALLNGIRAFEMRPSRFEGITKLGQNKGAAMRAGVIEALEARPGGAAIAAAMRALD